VPQHGRGEMALCGRDCTEEQEARERESGATPALFKINCLFLNLTTQEPWLQNFSF
jgi:hypothetical protein